MLTATSSQTSAHFVLPDFSGGEATVAKKLEGLGFSIRRKGVGDAKANQRNPDWSQDELILALDVYVKWDGRPPGKKSDVIADLSHQLNQLHSLLGTPPDDTLRNPSGVYMKLMNFRRFDPSFISEGKSGLSRGNKLEEVVWNEFHGEAGRLSRVAAAIREAIARPLELGYSLNIAEDLVDDTEAIEGRIMTVIHRRRERSRELVNKRKQAAIRKTGTVACEVCLFDFAARYGSRGQIFLSVITRNLLKRWATEHPPSFRTWRWFVRIAIA